MRSFYRMLTVLTVLAGVGSFIVEASRLFMEYGAFWHQADDAEVRARRDALKKICNWRLYEPTRQRLHDTFKETSKGERWSPEHLGIDWNYDYFYDFAADDIYCTRRASPGGPAVLSDRFEYGSAMDQPFVRLCICFIAVCGAALAITRIFR